MSDKFTEEMLRSAGDKTVHVVSFNDAVREIFGQVGGGLVEHFKEANRGDFVHANAQLLAMKGDAAQEAAYADI